MTLELKKRIITSIFLSLLLCLMYFYTFILIISVIIIAMISWIEFNGLIFKIFKRNKKKDKLLIFCYKAISLFYFLLLIYLVLFIKSQKPDFEIFIILLESEDTTRLSKIFAFFAVINVWAIKGLP